MVNLDVIRAFVVVFAFAGIAPAGDLYFPPKQGQWETISPADAGWDEAKLRKALDYAGSQRSSGVVILVDGKIMSEQYWEPSARATEKFLQRRTGRDRAGHGIEDVASAQKSVSSVLVGIAQEKGLLKIDDPVSKYLGDGWSLATKEQEQAITIRHLITMTSGLNVRGGFDTEPGTKWLYNTAAYAKTMDVVAAAAKMDRNELTKEWLTEPIGMNHSTWSSRGALAERAVNAYGFSTTARDLARFGLLMLSAGRWGDDVIISDDQYLKASTKSSQKLNPHYGYLWWVSRDSYQPRSTPEPASAPVDMFTAKGALNRRCYVVPSLGLVVTRLGDQPEAGKAFDNRFWKLLMEAAPK
ncbi:MAG: serine hydrolase [Planctomycetales bacterium]|nr:serine hydrolase [Planctomycetales bacterium]